MKDFEKLDKLLYQTLSVDNEPDDYLNQKIIKKVEERNRMKGVSKKKLSTVAMVAMIVLIMSVSVFAISKLLTPKEAAEKLGNKSLAAAFEGKDAIVINETQTKDGYNVTLLGIVTGEKISDFKHSGEKIYPERSYAVVTIAKKDGTPMPDFNDPEYDERSFLVTPLIKGQNPIRLNIFHMNGGSNRFIEDGVMYCLVECDSLNIFADRGLYLAVLSDTFYDVNAYDFNSKTGEIKPKADYDGVNILFNLPLDPSKGDHEKAEKYLQTLKEKEKTSDGNKYEELDHIKDWMNDAVLIKESVKKVVPDSSGRITYEFDGKTIKVGEARLFEEGQKGYSEEGIMIDGKNIVIFSKDDKGVITAMVYNNESYLKKSSLNN